MQAYRLSRKRYANSLSGKGAAVKGARWNSIGVELIYTASNRSLAMAEVAVHFTLATLPSDYMMTTLFIPDNVSLKKLNISDLPPGWNDFPHPNSTQAIGAQFIFDNKFCVLQIPSAVTQGDHNLLINSNHPNFRRIQIVETAPFPFDKRILK